MSQVVLALLKMPNGLFLGIILFILVGTWRMAVRLRQLYSRLEAEVPAGSASFPKSGVIYALINRCRTLRQEQMTPPDADALVAELLEGLKLRVLFWQVPVGVAERLIRALTSMPILLGLAGNFLGWWLALENLNTAFSGDGKAMDAAQLGAMVMNLKTPLSGLNTAFGLSMVGVAASLLLSLVTAWLSAPAARQRLAVRLESFLIHDRTLAGAALDTSEVLTRMYDGFRDAAMAIQDQSEGMTTGFDQVMGRLDSSINAANTLAEKMAPVAEGVSGAASAIGTVTNQMEALVQKLDAATRTFSGGTELFGAGLGRFGEAIEKLAVSQDGSIAVLRQMEHGIGGALEHMSDRIEELKHVEETLKQASEASLAELGKMAEPVVNATDQLSAQYSVLETKIENLTTTISTFNAAGKHLEEAVNGMTEAQAKFIQDLEQKIKQANQEQIAQLLESMNSLNQCLMESQSAYQVSMSEIAGTTALKLSELINLTVGSRPDADEAGAAGAR